MTLQLFGLERTADAASINYIYDMFEPVSRVKHVMTNSAAGTGKSTMAIASGVLQRQQMLYPGGLYYFTFPTKRGQQLGALPGDLDMKSANYFKPMFQALERCKVSEHSFQFLNIQMSLGTEWRGGNIKDAFVIIDEAQNGAIDDLQLIYTRCDDNCKIVTTGSDRQCDNNLKRYGIEDLLPFQVYMLHQAQQPYTRIHTLTKNYRGIQANHSDNINATIGELYHARKQKEIREARESISKEA